MTSKNVSATVLAVITSLIVASASKPATAALVDPCVVTAMNSDAANNLTISCNGTWYHAQVGDCGGTTTTIDAIKVFVSLAQAALLSGKNLSIDTNSAAGCTTSIIFMQLYK